MTLKTLERLKKVALDEYSNHLSTEPVIIRRRLRLLFKDGSLMDVRYPSKREYSFHWQKGIRIIRIDTAPHHPELKSFPRHIHYEAEERVIKDEVTELDARPERNLRNVLRWIKEISEE